MKWIPESLIISTLQPRLSANDYKTDLALNFTEDGADIDLFNGDFKVVSGLDSFTQTFKTTLLSNQTPLFDFGLQEFLPKSLDQDLFNDECLTLAAELLTHETSDSKPNNPDGLGFTIESISSIELIEKTNELFVTMKVTGLEEELTINVSLNPVKQD